MKLLKRDQTRCTFLLGARERTLLLELLRQYPAISSAQFAATHPPQTGPLTEHRQLLAEALAEQQKENRAQLEKMLNETGRFVTAPRGFHFHLSHSEVEWLLQVVNDIRVGSWMRLGEPGTGSALADVAEIAPKNFPLVWTMQMAGVLQQVLLSAAEPEEPAS